MDFAWMWRTSGLTRDGAAESISLAPNSKAVVRTGTGKNKFPCSADHEQDWQPYTVELYYALYDKS